MNTLEDLRRIFDEDASAAPDPVGVVAAAELGATRIRRRRRAVLATSVAVLVAAVSVAVPMVTRRHRVDGPMPAATAGVERGPQQVTLGVDGSSGYAVTSQDSDENMQRILFEKTAESPRYTAGAVAYDPNAGFDPTPLRSGERIMVSGHEAWYVGNYSFATYLLTNRTRLDIAAVGWQDPTGTWVLVFGYPSFFTPSDSEQPGRARLVQDAQAVRVEAMHEMTTPISLGPLPAGLPPLSEAFTDRHTEATVLLGGSPAPLDAAMAPGPKKGTAVMIEARPDGPDAKVPAKAARVAAVAGYPAWFTKATSGTALGNGSLWVRARGCTITFSAWDRNLATAKQLREIAAATTYADCAHPATWGPVIRG